MKQLKTFFLQEKTSELLLKSIKRKRLHQAYILYGQNGVGKLALALAFSRHLLCINSDEIPCGTCTSCVKMEKLFHPDLTFLFPTNVKDGNNDPKSLEDGIKFYAKNPFMQFRTNGVMNYFVESIRRIKINSKFAPTEAPRKVILLHQIEYMNDAASNAFLKLLEEPPPHTTILMTTSNIDRILATIKSRCQKFYLSALNDSKIYRVLQEMKKELTYDTDLAIKMANGNIKKAFEALERNNSEICALLLNFLRYSIVLTPIKISNLVIIITRNKNRDEIDDFLVMIEMWFRDASVFVSTKSEALLVNINLLPELNKFVNRYGSCDFVNMIYIVENARQKIRQNGNLDMILTNLSILINIEIKRIEKNDSYRHGRIRV